MNQNDRDFLHGMMLERMIQHYGASFPRDKERARRSSEMENKLTHALTLLPEEQVDEVHQYLEYLFERSAEAEELFYRSGLMDGIRLSNLFHSVEVDRLTVYVGVALADVTAVLLPLL